MSWIKYIVFNRSIFRAVYGYFSQSVFRISKGCVINNLAVFYDSAFSNPLFIDTEVFDFQLQSTSPCIDTGDPAYTPAENELDFNHNPRKVGACIDKGAYEKQ